LPGTPEGAAERRVSIRPPTAADESAYVAAVRRSADLIRPWNPVASRPADFRRLLTEITLADAESYFIVDRADDGLAALVNVRGITRARFQNASVGYNAYLPYAGTGRTREGMELIIAHCFDATNGLGLHRLEINVQPANEPSRALARRLGFRLEGTSPRMLYLNGAWRDHERYALTVEDWAQRCGTAHSSESGRMSG
jgi:ribosomal-protein-alanine N-acetyltransferase